MRGAANLVHMVEHGVADHEYSTALPGASSIASRSQTAAEVRVALLPCSVTAARVCAAQVTVLLLLPVMVSLVVMLDKPFSVMNERSTDPPGLQIDR